MDSSNRQSEILEKLAKIRKELARKERKLQKLKRLSALKKGPDSLQNESIGSDETRLSTSADVCSPLRVPLETTLPESEVCHSKSQRTKTPEGKFSRKADSLLQADTSDSHERRLQTSRSSSSMCAPIAITERDTALADGPSRLTVTVASPRRKSSRLEALSGRTRSQREPFANSVTHSSIENGDTASFSHALQVNSRLSVSDKNYVDVLQDTNENKVAEHKSSPKADSCKVSMQTDASLSVSRLDNAAFLDMLLQDSLPEVKDLNSTAAGRSSQRDKVTLSAEKSCGSVKPRFSQEAKVRCSVTQDTAPQQNGCKQMQSSGLSLVKWTKEDDQKRSSGKSVGDGEKCEMSIVAGDELHVEVLNPCDDDSRDSQQELFVREDEPGFNVDNAPLRVMAVGKDGITEQSAKEGTKTTEKQCDADKPPEPSESRSPVRKRRRTRSYEPTTITADSKDTNYNFRKRKLSYSPFWKRRMSRESKTIVSAFSKLIQGVLKTPASMFELNLEQFGLVECAKAKGLPTDPDSASHQEKSRLTVDGSASLERSCPGRLEACLEVEPDKRASTVNKGELRTLGETDSCALASQTEVFPAESMAWPELKRGRRSSRRLRQSSTATEGTAADSSTNDAMSIPDKHYAANGATMSPPLGVWETVGGAAPASNGNSDSINMALPSQLSGDYTAQASQHGERPRNTSWSQIGTSCVPLHVARNNREVPTPVLTPSACSDGGSCRQENSKSQRPSLSSPSITRCDKTEGSGKPEHVSRDESSEDTAVACDQAVPVLPTSEHSFCLDVQGSSELAERAPPLTSHLACRGEGESSQEAEDTDADMSTALRGEVVEYFSRDDCNVQGGGQASEPVCVTTMAGSIHGALFSQSEESESAEDIKDFVSGIVQRLAVADRSLPGLPSVSAKDPQDGSETPDELNLPEVVIGAPRASSGDPFIPSCRTNQCTAHTNPKDAFPESRRDGESLEEESTTLLASLETCNGISSAKEQSSDSPIPPPGLPSCVLVEEQRSKSDIDSICPPPAERDTVEECELRCTASRRPVAKRLFADPAASNRLASVVDSEPQELMDPCELEGMFDEWSEECNLNTAYLPAVKRDPKNATQGLKDSHRGDKPSASGRSDGESRSCERVDGSRIKAAEEGPSDGSEKDKSTYRDSESCNQGSQNESLAGTDFPAKAVAGRAEEVMAIEGDQCSESLSSSLQPLSGLSNFTEEEIDDGDLAACSESERQSEPQEIGSPEHRTSEPDCWGDEDGNTGEQDCLDAGDKGEGHKTLSDCGLVLGTKRPLLFFCELKCATKQPVSRVFVVRATPRPFLVSVQAGAVNVWHLEKTWRHTLVAGNIKFPVEEGQGPQSVLLLRCKQWSVLVYLSPRQAPLQLPCVLWDAQDGHRCCQLLLTLGEKGSATNEEEDSASSTKNGLCIYRLAQLSGCEGQFASALRTASGSTLLRVHRVLCFQGEFGDETEFLGRTSNLLDSLVPVKGLPSALLGNHANIFYVWDCENRVLVKKMVYEPDLFADMRHISWCCSERGLLFALMRSLDDVTSTLVVMNPFSCKAEAVCAASWKSAALARAGDSRPCSDQVEGRYVACVAPGCGVRIWNIFTGNAVADMRYQSSTSCAVAKFADSVVVAVGSDDGRVLAFTC